MKNTELSVDWETTVPTDLTVSSFSDHAVKKSSTDKVADGHEKQCKAFIRERQLMEIELSRKTSKIHTLQSELNSITREFGSKLKESVHEKQSSIAKFKAQLHLLEQKSSSKITFIERQLAKSEQQNQRWEELFEALEHLVEHIAFSDVDFPRLRVELTDSPELGDYVKFKMYKFLWNVKKENEELKLQSHKLQEKKTLLQTQLNKYEEDVMNIQRANSMLKQNVTELTSQLDIIKSEIEHGNYAVENFSRVESERDTVQKQLFQMERSFENLKLELLQAIQEKENVDNELTVLKNNHDVLQKSCDAVIRKLTETTRKLGEVHDEGSKLKSELKIEQTSKEELLLRFTTLRDKLKLDYEDCLFRETSRAKESTVQLYEEKIKGLNESNNLLMQKKDLAESAALEIKKKYEELYTKFHEGTLNESNQIRHLQQELQDEKEEHRNILLNFNKLQKTNKEKCLDYDKMVFKLQFVEQEIDCLRKSSNKRIAELENELGTNKARLEMFEKMETELGGIITEAAGDEAATDEALQHIADEIFLPTNAKHSFVKCVHLTRKVLELDRLCLTEKQKYENEMQRNELLSEELSKTNSLLEQVDQPYAYLIRKVKENETVIRDLTQELRQTERELEDLKKEKDIILEEKDILVEDFSKILENREEISKVKQQLTTLQTQHHHPRSSGTKKETSEGKKKKPKPKWR